MAEVSITNVRKVYPGNVEAGAGPPRAIIRIFLDLRHWCRPASPWR
ncbi:MAG: hypothetical protein HC793_02780 [Aquincola sp.]|nr:hypothetical protein [Aquincola sp.]